jgi:hypothetical protein
LREDRGTAMGDGDGDGSRECEALAQDLGRIDL